MSLVLIDRKKAAAYGQEAVAITRDDHLDLSAPRFARRFFCST